MSLALTSEVQTVFGDKQVRWGTVTFDVSYPTGGEALAASLFSGLSLIEMVIVASQDIGGGEQVLWDPTAETLMVFTADGTEASDTSDQSGVIVQLVVFGE